MRKIVKSLVVGASSVCLLGLTVPQCGGLNRCDFEKVSVNGFDATDNAEDGNHYAYAMEFFKADDAPEGYVYVGTGNNILNLVLYYVTVLAEGGDLLDAPIRPPEIRRYRPDLGPTEWEKPYSTIVTSKPIPTSEPSVSVS